MHVILRTADLDTALAKLSLTEAQADAERWALEYLKSISRGSGLRHAVRGPAECPNG
jgi:hypothetical protein